VTPKETAKALGATESISVSSMADAMMLYRRRTASQAKIVDDATDADEGHQKNQTTDASPI
jgi:hypothetical protein